jgi:membrane-associated PAP2 superfamily phosphatase
MTATRRETRLWLALLSALLLIYLAWPALDLPVSAWFYRPDSGFWIDDQPWVQAVHHTVPWVGRLLLVGSLAGWLLGRHARQPGLRRLTRPAAALFLGLVFSLGLLVNGVLKEHWGRARPVQVTQFGGSASFTPPWQPATQCRRNCSFVSGHAGTGFVLITLGALAAPRRRRFWLVTGWSAGLLLGALRIVQGGHFLSDVLFGGILLWGTSLAIRACWTRWRLRRWHKLRQIAARKAMT